MRLSEREVERKRRENYRLLSHRRVRSEEEAIEFINERGFLTLFGIKGVELPNLWDAHVRPWPEAWVLKQTLPQKKRCAYAKVIRAKGTFLSWEFWSKFFAVYGAKSYYEWDYREGLLDSTEKRILDLLHEHGPMDTHALRKAVGLPGKSGTNAFHQALTRLQTTFRVTAVGGSTEGWSLFDWDLVGAFVPEDVLRKGYDTPPEQAMRDIIAKYVENVVVSTPQDIRRVFRWEASDVKARVEELLREGKLVDGVEVEGRKGLFLSVPTGLR